MFLVALLRLLVTVVVLYLLQSAELHIYTDFLRIVLEILNAILTYALPRNPEVYPVSILIYANCCYWMLIYYMLYLQVVYAIMHRQEVFQPFRNHPRFNELLENIFTVCPRLAN